MTCIVSSVGLNTIQTKKAFQDLHALHELQPIDSEDLKKLKKFNLRISRGHVFQEKCMSCVFIPIKSIYLYIIYIVL